MIHPSYVEMIDKINSGNDREEAPLLTSRYSVVLATAKRARQLVSGVEPFVDAYDRNGKPRKPLSVAVDEFYEDKVHIVSHHDEPGETEPAVEAAEEPEVTADELPSEEVPAEAEPDTAEDTEV